MRQGSYGFCDPSRKRGSDEDVGELLDTGGWFFLRSQCHVDVE